MRVAAFLLLIVPATFGSASAWVESIEIQPAEPVTGDSVTVLVRGHMPDTCWSVTEATWAWISGDSLAVDIYTYDCYQRECDGCSDLVVRYERFHNLVVETADHYFVKATEHRDSEWNPGKNHIVADFWGEEETATSESTWGRLKEAYR